MLKEVLKHNDPEVRIQALVALGEIGPVAKSAGPAIVAALENDDFQSVRYAAAYALGKIGARGVADGTLEQAVKGGDPFLRMISAWALACINPDDEKTVRRAVQRVVDGLTSDDAHVRGAAARALADFQGQSVIIAPALVAALADTDPAVIGNALDTLASLGPKVLPAVMRGLKNEDLRLYAVRIIERFGPEAEEAVPALIELLGEKVSSDEDRLLRSHVQFALGVIGPEAKGAVPLLIESLSSDDDDVRNSACYALAKFGPAAQAAVPALRKDLKSEDEFVRLASVWALLKIQPGDRRTAASAVPLLTKALKHENRIVRAEAAQTLGTLGDLAKSAISSLTKSLEDNDPDVRAAAAEALKQLEK